MRNAHPRRFKILITISVLFTGLIIVFGFTFRQLVFHQTSKMLIDTSVQYFEQVHNELKLNYAVVKTTVSQSLHIIGNDGIGAADTLEERLSFVPPIAAALRQEQKLSAFQVGYDSGDYFIVRPINNDYMRKQFSAPESAIIVVDNIGEGEDGRRILTRLWFDGDLQQIGPAVIKPNAYDPRFRPWYKAAMTQNGETSSAPYLFHFIGQMGSTIGMPIENSTAVIAGDITLYHLSETIAEYQPSPSAELILLEEKNGKFHITAYKDPDKLITKDTDKGNSRSTIDDLGSEVLSHASRTDDFLEPFFTFDFNNDTWLGSTRKLKLHEQSNFYLTMLAPEEEVLEKSLQLQNQTLSYTLAMILMAIPLTWFLARKISTPMQQLATETARISRFEFDSTRPFPRTTIKEVDDLAQAMTRMEITIGQFITLISSLASEQDFDKLINKISEETMKIGEADGAFTYTMSSSEEDYIPGSIHTLTGNLSDPDILPTCNLEKNPELAALLGADHRIILQLGELFPDSKLADDFDLSTSMAVILPLRNRSLESIGALILIYREGKFAEDEDSSGKLAFLDALSGFAAVTLESRKMLRAQKELLESFIRLLAGAIDSKSPYTGGHCQRVPVLTKLLAGKACEESAPPFDAFSLDANGWEALHIASWLHDCGKVTTPEFVVDKSTKLETIHDRIHEIRMRFEVLKRDIKIDLLERDMSPEQVEEIRQLLTPHWDRLDDDFAFVAECNIGGEFMAIENVDRLKEIAEHTWVQTIDDRQGVSWEEMKRKERSDAKALPSAEKLLADLDEHLILRKETDLFAVDNPYGFKLDTPQYLYNRGELYNLTIPRGTLTEEDRYKINDHIVQTIVMLQKLPFPKHLTEVPDIAGGHHEKLDGTGYPKKLSGDEMSLEAKIMVIADIFEALTAADRPYKKAKKLSEAIRIMGFMEKDKHIDPDLFHLFLRSGAYREYAEEYLLPEQIDEVDIEQYINTGNHN